MWVQVSLIVGMILGQVQGQGQVIAIPQSEPVCECEDVVPPGEFTCEQQVKWGKCDMSWLVEGGFCLNACNRCNCTQQESATAAPKVRQCDDIAPDARHTCAEQAKFGKCERQWMMDGGFCRRSCKVCEMDDSLDALKDPRFTLSKLTTPEAEHGSSDDNVVLAPVLLDTFGNISNSDSVSDTVTKARRGDANNLVPPLVAIANELLRSASTTKVDSTSSEVAVDAALDTGSVMESENQPPSTSAISAPTTSTPVRARLPLNPESPSQQVSDGFSESLGQLQGLLNGKTGEKKEEKEVEVGGKLQNSQDCKETIMDNLATRSDLTLLYSIVQEMELNGLLSDPEVKVTFFAPTNKALNSLLEDENQDLSSILSNERRLSAMKRLVLYHTLEDSFLSADLSTLAISPTKLGVKFPLYINKNGRSTITLEGRYSVAEVVEKDVVACGSVMHVVDHVLMAFKSLEEIPTIPFEVVAYPMPPPPPSPPAMGQKEEVEDEQCKNNKALQILSEYEGGEVFISVLEGLELIDRIQTNDSPITLFVPRDQAMEQLVQLLNAQEGFEQLLTDANRDLVTRIMLYHVVKGRYQLSDMDEDTPLKTFNDEMLFPEVRNDRDVSLLSLGSSAQIVEGDLDKNACDVAVHLLDTVLLPFEEGTVTLNSSDINPADCADEPLPGVSACSLVVDANLCDDLGVLEGDYCAKSCGRCQSLDTGVVRKIAHRNTDSLYKPMRTFTKSEVSDDKTLASSNQTCQSIPEILKADENLSTITSLIGANLESILANPPAPLTVFIPTNTAFENLQEQAAEAKLDLSKVMTMIVGYHIVEGFNPLSSLSEGRLLNSMTGHEGSASPLQLRAHQDQVRYFVEGEGDSAWAKVQQGDVVACYAIIHIIDRVLLPMPIYQ